MKKKIFAAVMAFTIFAMPTTSIAAQCPHSQITPISYTHVDTSTCGVHENCKIVVTTHYSGLKCGICGGTLTIRPTNATVAHVKK